MKRLVLALLFAASAAQAAVINPLPNNIQNGQPADVTKVMANFNQIVANVNANAAALNATNIFTGAQQFSAGLTLNQGTIVSQVQNDNLVWLGLAGGTANALTGTAVVAPLAYQAGQRWKITAALANTGAMTLNVNGLGARAVTKFGGTALIAGDVVAGQVLVLEDDGVRFQMINATVPSGIPYADAGGTPNAIQVTYILPAKNMTLADGLDLTVGIPIANTASAVTMTPTINGITSPTWNVVKFVGNVEVAVAVGDIQGDAWFKADFPNSVWVLMNPATLSTSQIVQVNQQGNPAGTLIDFAGTSCPTGYLLAPTAQTNISRTGANAALFAAIGTTWGAGDGSTTFGEPWFPADYGTIQAAANVGTSTVGAVIAHSHVENAALNSGVGGGSANHVQAWAVAQVTATPIVALESTASTGGSANLPAGVRVLKCIKL